ncbi:MAG: Ig-like domain-containing protein [Gemmatimonadota bacterium]
METSTPAAIEATQGANGTVEVAGDVTLAARVKDSSGAAMSGVAVHWSIVSGGGSLASTSTTTDNSGTAQVVWTVGTTMGAGEARASVSGVSSSASFPVTLTPGPAATVTLSADTAWFTALDDTATYTAAAEDAYGNDAGGTIAWAVDDDQVATVSDGLVTAVGPGETFATATGGTAVDTLVVVVAQEPVGVTVSPAADTVASGNTRTFSADAADANGHGIPSAVFTWASSDTLVAVVDATGVATGRAVGSASIVATLGALSDTATITVTAGGAASVVVSPGTHSFAALDETHQFTATVYDGQGNVVPGASVTWSSTDAGVVTVDESGLATAAGNGSAGVVASAGGVADTAAVTVQQEATAVAVSPATATVASGATQAFSAEATDANSHAIPGAAFAWASLDTTVAVVDAAGVATGRATGTALITATIGALSDTATLTVTAGGAASVSVSPTSHSFAALDDTQQFTATVYDDHGNVVPGAGVTWSSTDDGVVTVDGSGLATAAGNGSAGVVASAGSVADTAEVTVQQVAANIFMMPLEAVFTAAGDTLRAQATPIDANGHAMTGSVTWTSTNSGVASVTDGLVQAVADGTTQIVATMDAAADSLVVTVLTSTGVSRTWTGSAGADWLTPLSWSPVGHPNASDSVSVPSGTQVSPMLNANAAVARVEVAGGATLNLQGHVLEVLFDVLADGAITATTGRLLVSETGSVGGTLPLLEVTGIAEASGPTTLSGLRLLGGTLRTQGQRVTIRP